MESTIWIAPGYAKANIDFALNTLSLVDELGRLWKSTGLGGEVTLECLEPRKKDGIHMNTWVGRVRMDDDGGRSVFEYGVTDLQRMANGKKKRKLNVQHIYVSAHGPRAQSKKNTDLCAWRVNQLVQIIGPQQVIDSPDSTLIASRQTIKNQPVQTVQLRDLHPTAAGLPASGA